MNHRLICRGPRVFVSVISAALIGGMSLVGAGCDSADSSGGDKDKTSSAIDFAASPCKDGTTGDDAVPELYSLYTMSDSRALEGLNCVSWKHDGVDKLSADLLNFTSACIMGWKGEVARPGPNQVDLIVENSDCDIGACGSCIYDWSFDLEGIPKGEDLALTVSVWVYPREGCDWDVDPADELEEYHLDISKDTLASGMVCRYVRPMELEWLQKIGGPYLYCTDTCDEGLECAPHPDADNYPESTICLIPCSEGDTDQPCPDPDLTSCIDGYCQLTSVWDVS